MDRCRTRSPSAPETLGKDLVDSLRYLPVVSGDGGDPRWRPQCLRRSVRRQPGDCRYRASDLLIGQGVDQPMKLVPCGRHTGDDTYCRRWLRNVSSAHVDNLLVAAATFANL